MSLSNAPGETRNNKRNECRIVITGLIDFSDKAIEELAPPWDKTAVALLRKLLDDGLRFRLAETYINQAMAKIGSEILTIKDIDVEAAP